MYDLWCIEGSSDGIAAWRDGIQTLHFRLQRGSKLEFDFDFKFDFDLIAFNFSMSGLRNRLAKRQVLESFDISYMSLVCEFVVEL